MKKEINNKLYYYPFDMKTNFRVEGRGMYTIIDALVYKEKVYALLESNSRGEEDMVVVKFPPLDKLKALYCYNNNNFYAFFIPECLIKIDTTYDNIVISLEDAGVIQDETYILLSDEELNIK